MMVRTAQSLTHTQTPSRSSCVSPVTHLAMAHFNALIASYAEHPVATTMSFAEAISQPFPTTPTLPHIGVERVGPGCEQMENGAWFALSNTKYEIMVIALPASVLGGGQKAAAARVRFPSLCLADRSRRGRITIA